jgi:hypothetical protein
VQGAVFTQDGTFIPGAYVAIVDALNVNVEYYNTISDNYGKYLFTGVTAGRSYKVKATHPSYGTGYSASFTVGKDELVPTCVVIFT